ncbi:MAG: ATP synthase subunit I [SAR324 cluster bacterium]|nr:ATP synthase subunit I [SAR324 cluster bacterium]MBL7034368.1 ATP synthase subunit I [SAR324 cluster bacterium]
MQSATEHKSILDSKANKKEDPAELSKNTETENLSNSGLQELEGDSVSDAEANPVNQAYFFQNILIGVSLILVAGTAIFQLDLILSVLLGCLVIGFNYYWTIQFVRKLLQERKLLALDLLFSLAKFGISVIVLFLSMKYMQLSAGGLLIGLSNLALTTIIYSFVRVMQSQKSA